MGCETRRDVKKKNKRKDGNIMIGSFGYYY
jgi:hypothetical protein